MFNTKAACDALNEFVEGREWRRLDTTELTSAERVMRFIERFVGYRITLGEEKLFYATYDYADELGINAVQVLGSIETRGADVLAHITGPVSQGHHEISYPYANKEAVFRAAQNLAERSPELRELVRYEIDEIGDAVLVGVGGAKFAVLSLLL